MNKKPDQIQHDGITYNRTLVRGEFVDTDDKGKQIRRQYAYMACVPADRPKEPRRGKHAGHRGGPRT